MASTPGSCPLGGKGRWEWQCARLSARKRGQRSNPRGAGTSSADAQAPRLRIAARKGQHMSATPQQHDHDDATPSTERNAAGLSERDLHILDFERRWWRHAGAKEEAIRAEFDLSAARYYQLLNAVMDLPGATQTDPMLVKRLQRARSDRMRSRFAHAFTFPSTSESND
jgi:hypothetical protein